MQSLGIYNDYKQEYRRAWCYYAVSIITINLLEVVTVIFNHPHYVDAPNDSNFAKSMLVFDIFQISVTNTVAVTLYLLFSNVYTRFVALNLLLRYFDFFQSTSISPLNHDFDIFWTRNHFLSGNKLNARVLSQKKESIQILKSISRQHLFLTGIIDRINSCYSIQVDFAIGIVIWLTFWPFKIISNFRW